MSLIRTGAEPMCAEGGAIVTDALKTISSVDYKCLTMCPCRRIPTDRNSVSVMFQKAFQKCTSSSGSMAYFPEFSPKATRPIAMVCRHGRMAGVNCREKAMKNKHVIYIAILHR
uniref:Uncharacterized protein n=1 Tax=Fundulus heteroclitus TaxID=8078 RepID=A0A3Q2QCN9_FUNHE